MSLILKWLLMPQLLALGADDWRAREEATRQLIRLGPLALPALYATPDKRSPAEAVVRKRLIIHAVEWPYRNALLLWEADCLLMLGDGPGLPWPVLDAVEEGAIGRLELCAALQRRAEARGLVRPGDLPDPSTWDWSPHCPESCGQAVSAHLLMLRFRARGLPGPMERLP